MAKQPAYFIPHGGGPWHVMDDTRFGGAWKDLEHFLKGLQGELPEKPKAILAITAHWDDPSILTISSAEKPGMYYDYYGFPPHTYEIKYPAPGAPDVAARVKAVLEAAGIPATTDSERGFDHGTFVPLMVAFPEAEIPVVQMSIRNDLDPAFHIAFGRALAPLRDEGILVLGSGLTYHNMRRFADGSADHVAQAERFDDWLKQTLESSDMKERDTRLEHWLDNPDAQACHYPTPEHFLPIMVAAGAGGDTAGKRIFKGTVMDKPYSAFRWD
ncbi:class III extradiol ring-cleavage dioxygenase [Rhizobium sp. L1K21]|uniref:DODA-type extradiol aromatic ring-opening family dioxygenase n=1 Tax=Rhizobium sp. L1K21 TaxID=2954933 RepID=UPI0020927C82|nr:class III extradiol ring-cleavage dioxygenase [Rhizobium sp. L1K21]MCO6185847.1 dioxygenase [Rhizobium sp. L1K21]